MLILLFQVCDLTEELQNVQHERDDLLSGRAQCEQDAQQLRDVLQTLKEEMLTIQADLDVSAQKENELRHQCEDVTQQLRSLHSELKRSEVDRRQLVASLEERDMKVNLKLLYIFFLFFMIKIPVCISSSQSFHSLYHSCPGLGVADVGRLLQV